MDSVQKKSFTGREIAVIGMTCRASGVANTNDLWQLSKSGKVGLKTFSRHELQEAKVEKIFLDDPNYVMTGSHLEGKNLFDASLFGYNARQAATMDPQMAKFHECAWEALEQAGCYTGRIGVYAGASANFPWHRRIMNSDNTSADTFSAMSMTSEIFLSTRVSNNFNLTGPSINLQTACSTSLVAVHQACQSLLTHDCDVALAGGSSITPYDKQGYLYQEGMILSPDGYCRPFDAHAVGTVDGEGVGVVVLKRLQDAIEDNDNILALIKGTAINNDGDDKQGFTAPSMQGQSDVILDALDIAVVDPATIKYVETHGTGTHMGDPIEIAALAKAYGPEAIKANGTGYCVIGALKSILGHTDVTAGVLGLIRAINVLQHKQFPPTPYFNSPNPELNLDKTPFCVNTELCDWESEEPRRAGVSAFGIGGTNAHVILEEACFEQQTSESRNIQMLFLSANTETALTKINDEQLQYLEQHPETSLPDLCYTRQVGRKPLRYRKAMAVSSIEELKQALASTQDLADNTQNLADSTRVHTGLATDDNKIGFLFPGQGMQYANMGKGLYETESVFRQWLDKCFNIAQEKSGIDFKASLFPIDKSDTSINQTENTQPLLFMLEYSLAQQLMHWGCKPDIMIGHSVGEYVAACLAGVFNLEDAITLIIKRGALIQALPSGDMLSVRTDKATIEPLLAALNQTQETVGIAAINSSKLLVVSGDQAAIATLQTILDEKDIPHSLLHTSHAFHSHHLDPALVEFKTAVEAVTLSSPEPDLPYISNVTGKRIDPEQATSPDYWVQHMRGCVQFSEGVETLVEQETLALLEVGPGQVLSTFVQQSPAKTPRHHCINLIPSVQKITRVGSEDETSTMDQKALFNGLCKLFTLGTLLDWQAFYEEEKRGIIGELPTYPFEGKAHWTPGEMPRASKKAKSSSGKKADLADWFYLPTWKPATPVLPPSETADSAIQWLIFEDECGLGEQLSAALKKSSGNEEQTIIRVQKGKSYAQIAPGFYHINPKQKQDYQQLIKALGNDPETMIHVVHLWSVYNDSTEDSVSERFAQAQQQGFNGIIYLIQSLHAQFVKQPCHISIITSDVQPIASLHTCFPEKAGVLGLNRVISQDYPYISSRAIDIHLTEKGQWQDDITLEQFITELTLPEFQGVTAIRNGVCWSQRFEPISIPAPLRSTGLRHNGVYLITGGLGKIGIALTTYLATEYKAKIILTSRSGFPDKSQWGKIASSESLDLVTDKIKLFQFLEEQGAQIDVYRADVSKKTEVNTLFQWIDDHYSSLNGVIHAAANINMEHIDTVGIKDSGQYFSAKVQGTENIAHSIKKIESIQNKSIDFCMLFSSLSTVLGGMGYANYAASNSIMDSLAQTLSAEGSTQWICINWDGWDISEADIKQNNEPDNSRTQAAGQYDFSADEGMTLFQRLVDLFSDKPQNLVSNPQIIVSTGDLAERYQIYACEAYAGKSFSHKNSQQQPYKTPTSSTNENVIRQQEYQAPSSEMEAIMITIWQQLLGEEHISVKDNFFSIGGDSLAIIQLTRLINDEFNTRLLTTDLFAYPSIAELCHFLSKEGDDTGSSQNWQEIASDKKKSWQRFKQKHRNVNA